MRFVLFQARNGRNEKKRELLNHNRRLERQRSKGLDMAAAFCLDDMDRHPELLPEEQRASIKIFCPVIGMVLLKPRRR